MKKSEASPRIGTAITEAEAAAKSSFLLLSYALELLLKAGLVAVYHGCSMELFASDLRRYSHNLVKVARAVEFTLDAEQRKALKFAQECVLHYARYPLMVPEESEHISAWNKQNSAFWDAERYEQTLKLARAIRAHTSKLDHNEKNPATFASYLIENDGYISFRIGGGLSSRVTVKYSTAQRKARNNNKRWMLSAIGRREGLVPTKLWRSAAYKVVKK